ncbi:BTB/POZ/MATH-domain protein [Rhynchospora pubera]|uniref:BTB/POZ/MATH-domain protein n=1 Tax=Rhynchospora pubera TaxID=906938 RepID=A0AAV8F4B5_9POAL|nr:BTB/POZ/MATH-domain protein [Rhynchospora pubera]
MASGTFDGADIINMTELASGSYQFRVNYWQLQGIAANTSIASPVFTIGGHDWRIRLYPTNLFLELYLQLQGISRNVRVIFDFGLFDKAGEPYFGDRTKRRHRSLWSHNAGTFKNRRSIGGWSQFIEITKLRENCLREQDGRITVVCNVIVLSADHAGASKQSCGTVPPWSLPHHIGQLMESKETVDVNFEVSGKIFGAHKLILAARSPVFEAQFFGSLNYEGTTESIVVDEIEPRVFSALLHFIYTDLLPHDANQKHCEMPSIAMMQHLLVAADRYAIDKLKSICEENLCKRITDRTVATTLALAEQHNCPQLRAFCLNYAANPQNLVQIALTDGFAHLLLSCPEVIKELRRKLKTINH